jgi:hypothetical protein
LFCLGPELYPEHGGMIILGDLVRQCFSLSFVCKIFPTGP